MAKSILLTGASGFIGKKVLMKLSELGYHVYAVSRSVQHTKHDEGNIRWVNFDLQSRGWSEMLESLPPLEAVIHLAANPKLGIANQRQMEKLHLEATFKLARFASVQRIRFFHVSTAFVSPDKHGHLSEDSASSRYTGSIYEQTKTKAEHLIEQFSQCQIEIFRPGIVLPDPSDSVVEMMLSPLGMFCKVIDETASYRDNGDLQMVELPFCRRMDIANFIVNRLSSAGEQQVMYWNLISPYSLTVRETARVMGISLSQSIHCHDFPYPWNRFLTRKRSWDLNETFAESIRQEHVILPITINEIESITKKINQSIHGNIQQRVVVS